MSRKHEFVDNNSEMCYNLSNRLGLLHYDTVRVGLVCKMNAKEKVAYEGKMFDTGS